MKARIAQLKISEIEFSLEAPLHSFTAEFFFCSCVVIPLYYINSLELTFCFGQNITRHAQVFHNLAVFS